MAKINVGLVKPLGKNWKQPLVRWGYKQRDLYYGAHLDFRHGK